MKLEPRPYLIIPKLIEQPTWGGQYIATAKGWANRPPLSKVKIGQSYELFSGSNLSLLSSSDNPAFEGELTNSVDVEIPTQPRDTIALKELVATDPTAILGESVVRERGKEIKLLIKFTDAKGNSFQVHMKSDVKHVKWKPKPESWYYFEPGLITLGIRPDINWKDYEHATRMIEKETRELGDKMQAGQLSYPQAQTASQHLLKQYNPWQYVNTVQVAKDELVDLSSGGLHHSWEEDSSLAPLGNVLLELQAEALDPISTFRSFDKGKIAPDGTVRSVQVDEYFEFIDRSPEVNDPKLHIHHPVQESQTDDYTYTYLMTTPFYNLDKLTIRGQNISYKETIDRYKHVFLRSGKVTIATNHHAIALTAGHSCFIPANAHRFQIISASDTSELLISY